MVVSVTQNSPKIVCVKYSKDGVTEKEAANTRPLSFIRCRRFLPVCRLLHLLRQGVCAFL